MSADSLKLKRWLILPPATPLTWIESLPSETIFLKSFTPCCFTHTYKKGPGTERPKLQLPHHCNRSFHLQAIQHGSHPTSDTLCQVLTKDLSRLSPRQRLTCWPLGVHWSFSALKPTMCKTFTEPGSLQQTDHLYCHLHQCQSKNRSPRLSSCGDAKGRKVKQRIGQSLVGVRSCEETHGDVQPQRQLGRAQVLCWVFEHMALSTDPAGSGLSQARLI